MEFRILGPLEVVDRERLLALGGPKQRALLALLLLHANRTVSLETLIDGVWGDSPPRTAVGSVHNHVLALRRLLGSRLETRPHGYFLRVEEGELDALAFRALLAEARGRPPAEAAGSLRRALALWRGPPLADLADEPVGSLAGYLEELRLSALEDRIEADLLLGRHAEVVPELEQLVTEQPFRERLQRQLVLALYRSERQADALAAYVRARRILVDEVGAEPSEELQALHRAVLRHDPGLALAPADGDEPPAPAGDARRDRICRVVVVAADLVGETPRHAEARREVARQRRATAERVVARYGGTVRPDGERLDIVFGLPVEHEDDALRATVSALELIRAGAVVRAGSAAGEAIGEHAVDSWEVTGGAVGEADDARAQASGGELVATESVWRLIRHAATARRRAALYVVGDVDDRAEPRPGFAGLELVGRRHELALALELFARAVDEQRPRGVRITGEAGIGKTRFAAELAARLAGSAMVLSGHCRAFGEGSADAPLLQLLGPVLRAAELAGDCRRVAELLGRPSSPERELALRPAVTRLLAALARRRPVLVVLDEIDSASPDLHALLAHVLALGHGPLLVVAVGSGERVSDGLSVPAIELDPLTHDDSEALLELLAEHFGRAVPDRDAIIRRAGGNPLFLEELSAAALEGEGLEHAIPESIQSVVASRIDRLPPVARAFAEAAAACGPAFSVDVLEAIGLEDVGRSLAELSRRRLVVPCPHGTGDAWRFRHDVIRETVYQSIPLQRRARLRAALARAHEPRRPLTTGSRPRASSL